MKKGLTFVLLFFASLSISISYQNCGSSSVTSNSSNNNDLQIDVAPNGNGDSDGSGDNNGAFSFDLGKGDNIFYINGGGLSLDLSTIRILAKNYYTILESRIYEQSGTTFARDLPDDYCANSALPHCLHLNGAPCLGFGCFEAQQPVRCHWQKRLSDAEINTTFQAINEITFAKRDVQPEDPSIADCNNPLLSFFKQDSELELSLAPKGCVSDGQYYASRESGNPIRDILNNELKHVSDLMNNQGSIEFCNNYSSYAWDTSKWSYRANPGMPSPQGFEAYEVEYEAQMVDIRFKEGTGPYQCATGLGVQKGELDAFFPQGGIPYTVIRTEATVADAPTTEITYEDPVDGGLVWNFILDGPTDPNHGGGAVMSSNQAQAIEDTIAGLIARAKSLNVLSDCP